LNLFDVVVDFDGVVPCNRIRVASVLALWVLNNKFETLQFLKHHRLLAIDHLSAHRVVKISHLLESHALLVELFSILSHVEDRLGDLKSMLSQYTGIFNQRDKLDTVIYFEETPFLVTKIKLHQLATHLVLLLLIGVLECLLNRFDPVTEQFFFIALDLIAEVLTFTAKLLHATQISEHTLGSFQILLKLEGELAGPDYCANCVRDILTLRRFFHPRNLLKTLACAGLKLMLRLLNFIDKLG
jgi:hypothetical protein